jgi:allantoicase
MMERNFNLDAAAFSGSIDLAQEKLGGKALLASDEFFAEKENLLKPGRGVFIADKYTEFGKWMDGWETRRKRVPGYDWCIIKLGVPGVIRGVDIDTNNFLGNHPPYASIDGLCIDGDIADLADPAVLAESNQWVEILPRVPLKQGSQNIFAVASEQRWTHVRLNIYPDGGVARFRVYGEARPDWSRIRPDQLVDLVAIENGGTVVAANDMFFGSKDNLIMPGRGVNMGDGWETRRRRGPGHDWVVVRMGQPGIIKKIEVDTCHYKGNYPDVCWIEACNAPGANIDILNAHEFDWTEVLGKVKLKADNRHFFESELKNHGPWTHVRLSIAPDGGISRLRVHCTLAAGAAQKSAGKNAAQTAGATSR